jgi:hypothetical protein
MFFADFDEADSRWHGDGSNGSMWNISPIESGVFVCYNPDAKSRRAAAGKNPLRMGTGQVDGH